MKPLQVFRAKRGKAKTAFFGKQVDVLWINERKNHTEWWCRCDGYFLNLTHGDMEIIWESGDYEEVLLPMYEVPQ